MKSINIFDSWSVENISDKILKIAVQPAQTNGIERVKRFVNVHLIASSETWKRINKFRRYPTWKNSVNANVANW